MSLDSNLLHVKRRNTVIARGLRTITWQKICWTVISIQRPEILSGAGYDDAVDWWSLGCIMFKMLIGIEPFRFNKDESLSPDVYEQALFFPEYVTKEAKDLIKNLLIINPKKRLGSGPDGAEKIKSHPAYKYRILREEMQDYMLEKLQSLIEQYREENLELKKAPLKSVQDLINCI